MINLLRRSLILSTTFTSLSNIGTSHSAHSMAGSSVAGSSPVVVAPSDKHSATLIFFHGLGDQGYGWSDLAKTSFKDLKHVKFIFPNAANRKVTLNFGMNMPAWYDLFGLTPDTREDDEGIAAATKYVHDLIDMESKLVPSNRILVGGFSMGGALALFAGLTYKEPLGGIVGLSSFLLQRDKIPGNHSSNLQTPVFLGHGQYDNLVPFQFGQLTEKKIKEFNPNVELRAYPMDHSSCPQELNDLKSFLEKQIPPQ